MVQEKGMKNLGVYRFGQTIQKYLFMFALLTFLYSNKSREDSRADLFCSRQHVVMQAISAQPYHDTFHFDYDLGNSALESATSMPEASSKFIYNVFMILQNSKAPNEQTTSVLLSTISLMNLLLAQYEGEPNEGEETFNLQFLALKSQIQSQLSAYDPMCPCHGDFTYESCRLSCLLVVEAVETCKPLNQTSQLLTSCLSDALERTDLSNTWGDMLGVLYWVSMIGSAAWKGRGGPGEKMMDSTLGSTMFKVTFEGMGLGCAIRPARLFGRLQMALKTRCEMMVSRLSSSIDVE